MIPNGVIPADDQRAADIFECSLRSWRAAKRWQDIPGLVLLREGGGRRARVYPEVQLLAARAIEVNARKRGEPPVYDLPAVPIGISHPDDLLDLEEAREALPAERRPSLSAWKSYRYGSKTQLPAADFVLGGKEVDGGVVGGTEFWYRHTILTWDENRPKPGWPEGTGRPAGSKDSVPRGGTRQGEARRQLVRAALAKSPKITAAVLAPMIDVHAVHAERLLREARMERVGRMLADDPDLTAAAVGETFGVNRDVAGRLLRDNGGSDVDSEDRSDTGRLLDANPHLATGELAAAIRASEKHATRLLREARMERVGRMLADDPDLTAAAVGETFGVNRDVAGRLLHEARANA
ncbi:hypothetical protein [Streptomyces sp. SM12]|uniref:hypothetical protein n=1 Tax=Streptomyces sp. SM12 TaxID=1071602 RepID=UPI000CD523CB|nr:hypothetical protein [Streptomyces sp. SM12]